MSISTSSVKTLFSELSSVDDSLVQSYIDIAIEYVNLSFWGSGKFDFIHSLMTAHLMVLNNANGTSTAFGPVLSEKLGDIQASYGIKPVDMNELSSTKYGAQIIQLRRSIIKIPLTY